MELGLTPTAHNFHQVTILMDGVPVSANPDHDGDVGKGYALEQLDVDLSREQLAQFAKSQSVEGKIGIYEFHLTEHQQRVVREFAAYVRRPDIAGRP